MQRSFLCYFFTSYFRFFWGCLTRKSVWIDAETIVEKAFLEHPKEVRFEHAKQNSLLDKEGKDFIVEFLPYCLTEPLQVKTSDNGETVGIVLPFPNLAIEKLPKKISGKIFDKLLVRLPHQVRQRISRRMLQHIVDHFRKHQDVRWILFVARPNEHKDENGVKAEIWQEIKRNVKILKKRRLAIAKKEQ